MKLFFAMILVSVSTMANAQDAFRVGVGASISAFASEHYDDVVRSNVPGVFEADLDHETALSLELEGRFMKPHSFGGIIGLTYDFERDFNGGFVFGNGRSISISPSAPSSLQTTVVYANLAYQADALYFPFGLNYSFYDYTPTPGFTGTADLDGDVGLQFGLGLYVTPNVVLESMYRILSTEYREFDNGITTDYGDGSLTTVQFTMKYIF